VQIVLDTWRLDAVVPGLELVAVDGNAGVTDPIERAERQHWPAAVLLGEPGFYGRFGFQAAGPLGVVYETVGTDSP
jgi:predicted N-acetyltransferase YhbS